MTHVRIYTEADARVWVEQLRDNRIKTRTARLALAWQTLKTAHSSLCRMAVCDGFAYDADDATSALVRLRDVSVSPSAARETRE